jgi:hypothetical protein
MRVSYRRLLFTLSLLWVCLLAIPATRAGNNSFISDAPIGKFTDEDMQLMNANLDAALSDAKLQVIHAWINPSTKHSGTAKALQAFNGPNGLPCKRVSVKNRAGNLKGSGQYTMCRMADKGWTFVPKDYASPPQSNPTQ